MSLAILVPVLHRPHRVQPLMDSIRAQTPDAQVVFICDRDDEDEREAINADRRADTLMLVDGNYAHKINAAVDATDTDHVFLGADDLEFHRGWYEEAAQVAEDFGVVGTQDLANRRVIAQEHSTHSLVTRRYCAQGTIDNPRKLLHEGYPHEYVDDEFVATAKHRGEFAFCATAIVEHLHPMVGKAEVDELYAMQRQRMRAGWRVYRRRQHLWGASSR